MGKLRIAGIVAAVALLAASAALAADSRKLALEGSLDDDSTTTVKLTSVKQGGTPVRIQNVRFKDLTMDCRSREERVELRLSGAAKLDELRKFEKTYEDGPGQRVKLAGKVRRDGKRVRAEMSGTTVNIDGAGRCKVPTVEFTAKR